MIVPTIFPKLNKQLIISFKQKQIKGSNKSKIIN